MAPFPDTPDLRVDGGVVFINGHTFEGFIPKFIGLEQEDTCSIQGELMSRCFVPLAFVPRLSSTGSGLR